MTFLKQTQSFVLFKAIRIKESEECEIAKITSDAEIENVSNSRNGD